MKNINYTRLLKQIISVTENESNSVANLSNITSILHDSIGGLWTGFYMVDTSADIPGLVLGPFQGPVACTRIAFGSGVCGTALSLRKTQVISDVHAFPGHIACSSLSNSEIVIPLFKNGEVFSILDIDSTDFSFFDDVDKQGLEAICSYIETIV